MRAYRKRQGPSTFLTTIVAKESVASCFTLYNGRTSWSFTDYDLSGFHMRSFSLMDSPSRSKPWRAKLLPVVKRYLVVKPLALIESFKAGGYVSCNYRGYQMRENEIPAFQSEISR